MKQTTSWLVKAPLDRVAEALCSEAYNLDESNSREDVVSATYELVDQGDDGLVFEMHCVEYKRTRFGRIDKSGTVDAHTVNTWDANQKSLHWVYHGHEGHRISISGTYFLTPEGDQTRVAHDTEIGVRIPVVGERIAKIIVKEFNRAMPRIQRILDEHVSADAS